ncbi:MAG: hypothetical protein HYV60_08640 [Planctomycetia bacterium]|nr:hypothetical protein [Planctomycetia bacterium]
MRSFWKLFLTFVVVGMPILSVGCSGGSYMSEEAAKQAEADSEDPDDDGQGDPVTNPK